MSAPFEGVLAVVGKTTRDGRRLAPRTAGGVLTRDLPLVIVSHEGVPDGRIDRVWLDGDLVRYAGRVGDATAEMVRLKLAVGNLDVDRAEMVPVPDDDLVLVGWRVVAATMGPHKDRAWEEVSMKIVDEPEETSDATREALDIWEEPWPGDDTES